MKMDKTKQMNELQYRSYLTDFEPGQDEQKIVGYAAVFNLLSDDLGGFQERIMPGAFTKTIREADVRAFWNHNPDFPLGRKKNGTLELSEDVTGLRYVIDLPDTSYARDLKINIKAKTVDQSSFAFQIIKRGPMESNKGMPVQVLQEVRLIDVSPVSLPAYPQTLAALRSMALELSGGLRLEDAIRDDPEFVKRCLEGLNVYARAGRVLSAKNEENLRQAMIMLEEVLAQLEKQSVEESSAPGNDLKRMRLSLSERM
jgi:HK97 family phage prohead protease